MSLYKGRQRVRDRSRKPAAQRGLTLWIMILQDSVNASQLQRKARPEGTRPHSS